MGQEKIMIESCEEIQLIGVDSNYLLSGNYILKKDIDCKNVEFQPIGDEENPFGGIFDGNGYEIRNLAIDESTRERVGLFSKVDSGGKIFDLRLKNVDISGGEQTGGLVGYNSGNIRNVHMEGGIVEGDDYVGGIVATNWKGSINDSGAKVEVKGDDLVGGLVGWNQDATIKDSYATGNVEGNKILGGLVGRNEKSDIRRSYAKGKVQGEDDQVGGLIGHNVSGENETASVEESYSRGNVEGGYWGVGGFVGFNEGIIKNSHSGGDVNWNYDEEAEEGTTGGFVGYNLKTVKNSYATGDVGEVDNDGNKVGGFVGYLDEGVIKNSYSVGNVVGNIDYAGVFGGRNNEFIKNSFAYKQDGEKDCVGKIEENGTETECLLVDEIENFYEYEEEPLKDLYDKWDFDSVWAKKYINEDYPVLLWVIEPEEEKKAQNGVLSKLSAGQRPIPRYKNPMFAEETEEIIKEIQEGTEEIKEKINSLIEMVEKMDKYSA